MVIKMTLLHLVSEQVVQNLIPALALKPRRVIQLASAEKRYSKTMSAFESALKAAGLEEVSCEHVSLESRSPEPVEVEARIRRLVEVEPIGVINITGGTKLMAIGAFNAARSLGIPCLYVDSASQRIVWLNNPGNAPEIAFADGAHLFSIPVWLCAHGVDPGTIKGISPSDALRQFGREAARLRRANGESIGVWIEKSVRPQFHTSKGAFYEKGGLREALGKALDTPPRGPVAQYVELALEAGLLRRNGDAVYLAPDPVSSGFSSEELKNRARDNFKTLEGGWFELAVADAMMASGKYRDVLWEVQSGSDQALGETDVVAMAKGTPSLLFVSCKSSDTHLNKPLEHLGNLRMRANRFGGSHSRASFCLFRSSRKTQDDNIREFCRILQVQPLIGEECLTKW